jgi:hypothetical protein
MSQENKGSEVLARIVKKIRITKVVATKSVKGRDGDSFAGFSAAWDSIQDDYGGPGADLMSTSTEDQEQASQGMTLQEASVAMYVVQMNASMAALDAARANGSITKEYYADQKEAVKKNFQGLIQAALERIK